MLDESFTSNASLFVKRTLCPKRMTISATSYLETHKPPELRATKAIVLHDLDLHITFFSANVING